MLRMLKAWMVLVMQCDRDLRRVFVFARACVCVCACASCTTSSSCMSQPCAGASQHEASTNSSV